MDNLIGKDLGHYHILELLGEGGMAVVYRALDSQLNRIVAVKVIRSDKSESEKFKQRFDREAKILAKLAHPNIVQVLDYGEYENQAYLVMTYVQGGTLLAKMKAAMGWQEAAKLLAPIAHALEYAHAQKVIHRDVKPSNLLFSERGDPMLSDFGIAKILGNEESISLTVTGNMVGSPEYMAPEQGMSKAVDQRVDIYALGTIFYQMVTGRRPYHEDTPMATLMKKVEQDPVRPTELKNDLPKAVEQVILKAMARRPEDRFQNMGLFARILEQLAQGDMTVSKEFSASGKRDVKAINTRFWGLGLIGVLVILLGGWALLGKSLGFGSLGGLFAPAASLTFTATPVKPTPTFIHTFTVVPSATSTPTNTLTPSPTPLPTYPPISSNNIDQMTKLQTFDTGDINYVGKTVVVPFAFSGDGDLLAINGANKVTILNTANWELVLTLDGTPPVSFSPDGKLVITSGDMLRVWNTADGSLVNKIEGMQDAGQIVFSPDGEYMASANFGQVWLWRVSDGKLLNTINGFGFAFSPDNKTLAINENMSLGILDINSCISAGKDCEAGVRNLPINLTSGERSIVFSPDGSMVWYMARLWSVSDGKVLLSSPESWGAAFSPDGKTLAVALSLQTIQLYDATTQTIHPEQIFGSINPSYLITPNIFLADSSALIIHNTKNTFLANPSNGKPIYTFDQVFPDVTVSPGGKFILVFSVDIKSNKGSLDIWGINP